MKEKLNSFSFNDAHIVLVNEREVYDILCECIPDAQTIHVFHLRDRLFTHIKKAVYNVQSVPNGLRRITSALVDMLVEHRLEELGVQNSLAYHKVFMAVHQALGFDPYGCTDIAVTMERYLPEYERAVIEHYAANAKHYRTDTAPFKVGDQVILVDVQTAKDFHIRRDSGHIGTVTECRKEKFGRHEGWIVILKDDDYVYPSACLKKLPAPVPVADKPTIKIGDIVIATKKVVIPGIGWTERMSEIVHEHTHMQVTDVRFSHAGNTMVAEAAGYAWPLGCLAHAKATATPTTQPVSHNQGEPKMDTKKPAVETKTFIHGIDAASVSDSDIFSRIAAIETEIRDLDKIENKPKKLVKVIENKKADIKALMDFVDGRSPQ